MCVCACEQLSTNTTVARIRSQSAVGPVERRNNNSRAYAGSCESTLASPQDAAMKSRFTVGILLTLSFVLAINLHSCMNPKTGRALDVIWLPHIN